MAERALCPRCRKEILWTPTESGKMMPLDFEAEKRWVVVDPAKSMMPKLRNTRSCHFETCPKGFKPDAET